MISEQIQEYLCSEQYLKYQIKFINELNTALANVQSENVDLRLAGAKRLSAYSRRELGWNCLSVREWFLSKKSKEILKLALFHEDDEKVLEYLLSTVNFFYERYMTHPMWEELYDLQVDVEHKEWLRTIAEKFMNHESHLARQQTAFILAEIGDCRAWDVFNELLKKRASISAWARRACQLYAKDSMTAKQRETLIQTFETVMTKSKNMSVCRNAELAKEACAEVDS